MKLGSSWKLNHNSHGKGYSSYQYAAQFHSTSCEVCSFKTTLMDAFSPSIALGFHCNNGLTVVKVMHEKSRLCEITGHYVRVQIGCTIEKVFITLDYQPGIILLPTFPGVWDDWAFVICGPPWFTIPPHKLDHSNARLHLHWKSILYPVNFDWGEYRQPGFNIIKKPST